MRLIGTLDTEKAAYTFSSFLSQRGVRNAYEAIKGKGALQARYCLWVEEEDDYPSALEWFSHFQKHPEDSAFQVPKGIPQESKGGERGPVEEVTMTVIPPPRKRPKIVSLFLTQCVVILCTLLFLWNDFQKKQLTEEGKELAAVMGFTSIQTNLMFDFPQSLVYLEECVTRYPIKEIQDPATLPQGAQDLLSKGEQTPAWRGIMPFIGTIYKEGWEKAREVPLFEKISQGEGWRLFTPALLHSDFLHILFNMAWAWILLKQMEARMRRWKMALFIIIVGVISNTAQYLVAGPYFLGFSGVVVGVVGFIWMRQQKAPWEGYPLHRGTIRFFLWFVVAMCAFEGVAFLLRSLTPLSFEWRIANTAHVVGGLLGIALGRLKFFARGRL